MKIEELLKHPTKENIEILLNLFQITFKDVYLAGIKLKIPCDENNNIIKVYNLCDTYNIFIEYEIFTSTGFKNIKRLKIEEVKDIYLIVDEDKIKVFVYDY